VPADEIIVIDDGSPDHPEHVCERFPGVRCIRQENMGVSAARNAGLAAARGSYVIFLDADDRLLPQAIERHLSCFDEQPQIALVFGRYWLIDEHGQVTFTETQSIVHDDHFARLLAGCIIGCPASVMYRRDIVVQMNGFDGTIAHAEDYDLYLRIARVHPIQGINDYVAEHRRHSENASSNAILMLQRTTEILGRQKAHVSGEPRLESALREGLTHAREIYCDSLYWSAVKSLRARCYRRGFRELGYLGTTAPGILLACLMAHSFARAKRLWKQGAKLRVPL
jgi:glycosyltransferase involved in cell wall biosynthesis